MQDIIDLNDDVTLEDVKRYKEQTDNPGLEEYYSNVIERRK